MPILLSLFQYVFKNSIIKQTVPDLTLKPNNKISRYIAYFVSLVIGLTSISRKTLFVYKIENLIKLKKK